MNANNPLTDNDVHRSNAFRNILENVKDMTSNIKTKIALDEQVPNKQK